MSIDDFSKDGFARFESLGDNCEFGFLRRILGVEQGSLLRWALTQPAALIRILEDKFADFYQFENLEPFTDHMVRDVKSGICFHSAMESADRVFLQDETERKLVYQKELEKVHHLLARFLTRLADPRTIFVYKTNSGVSDEEARAIKSALRGYGGGPLLVVRATNEAAEWGKVVTLEEGLYLGFIDRFAPYFKAADLSVSVWKQLLTATLNQWDGATMQQV